MNIQTEICFGGSFLVVIDVISHVMRLERNENPYLNKVINDIMCIPLYLNSIRVIYYL